MRLGPRAHVAAALGLALLLVGIATSARQPRPHPLLRAAYVDAGGLRLRYVRSGSGPTVVLLHGYGESLIAWRGVLDALSRESDVIALDLPGFGLSSKPVAGYTTDSMAARVVDAVNALGVGRFGIVGHSMGGAVSAAVVAADPARITSLVLLDAALVGHPAGVPRPGDPGEAAAATRRAIAEYESMRTRFGTSPHDAHWLAETDSAAAYLPASDPAYVASAAAVLEEFDFDWLTPERAARLTVPTLVLWGEFDQVFPIEAGRQLAAAIRGAGFEVIPRTWHRPHEERPEAAGEAIGRFLAGGKAGIQPQTH